MKIDRAFIRDLKNKLRSLPGIKVAKGRPFPKSSEKEILEFGKFIKKNTPSSIQNVYSKIGGITFRLEFQKNDYDSFVYGESFILGPDSLISGPRLRTPSAAKKGERLKGYCWDDGDDTDLAKKMEEEIFILDYIDSISNTYTVFKLDTETSEPRLFSFKYPHHLFPLTLSFEDYFEKTLEYRCIFCWQDYFIDKSKLNKEALDYLEQERPDRFLKDILEIHPGVDLSKLPNQPENNDYSFSLLAKEKNYNQRFREQFQSLKLFLEDRNGTFELEENRHPLTILTIRKIEYILGERLPDDILAFYSQLNGFSLNWSLPYDENGTYQDSFPMADFKLFGLEHVFGGLEPWNNRVWHNRMFKGLVTFEEVMDEEELAFAEQCKLIYTSEQDKVVMRLSADIEEPELYLMDRANFIKLQLTFAEFIECLIENLGITHWPWFFTSTEDYPDSFLSTHPSINRYIQEIFPEVDTSKYREVESNLQ
ncbi:MAG: hypothetical protein AB4372_15025 [Xenococcus sp. (in: cyanobacteria)]